jgi:DNA-binding SARP family transcriptional activator
MDTVKSFYLEKYKGAMFDLAKLYFEHREFNKCIDVLNTLLFKDSWHEDSYLLQMKCYLAKGEKTKAFEVYKRCCVVLKDELNINPSQSIVDLYKGLINISNKTMNKK